MIKYLVFLKRYKEKRNGSYLKGLRWPSLSEGRIRVALKVLVLRSGQALLSNGSRLVAGGGSCSSHPARRAVKRTAHRESLRRSAPDLSRGFVRRHLKAGWWQQISGHGGKSTL